MNESIAFFDNICPLTGLPTKGQATVKSVGAKNDVLYTFAPIGRAIFSFQIATALAQRMRQGDFEPRLDLAALCRQAAERAEPPLDITNEVFGVPRIDVPNTFDEKRSYFLQLLYSTGGNEYKERDILIHEDFPLAFAKDAEEFTRILKSLIREGWLEYDKPSDTPNDWVGGIRTHYNSVLISREGMKRVKESLDTSIESSAAPAPVVKQISSSALATLHPAVQSVASSRFATAHYSDAIQKACTALEKAVQARAQQPATVTGASLMTTAFSKNNALIHLSADPNEQFGFMSLYQGAVLALRNHYAHNLTELTDAARALEWLGFISALFYKLDEKIQLPQ